MESKSLFIIGCITVLILLNFASCDVAKDREKCANSLVGVATCLPYVTGEAKAPPSDCCSGFNEVVKKNIDCVCLLIKDRDDPSLGLKINATLALSLPARCKTPTNESINDCPTILHLPPNSPDAKVFTDFAKSANQSNTTTSATTTPAAAADKGSPSSASSADAKSDGEGKKILLLEAQMVSGILIAMVALHISSQLIFN